MTQFNNRIRQVVLLLVIAFLAFLIIRELYVFLPGLMGFIFGLLILSYAIILIKIYTHEFVDQAKNPI